jgi:hypothetical protein
MKLDIIKSGIEKQQIAEITYLVASNLSLSASYLQENIDPSTATPPLIATSHP